MQPPTLYQLKSNLTPLMPTPPSLPLPLPAQTLCGSSSNLLFCCTQKYWYFLEHFTPLSLSFSPPPPPPIANHNPMSKLLGVLSCQLFLVSPPLLKYEALFQLRGLLQVESVDAGVVHQEKISGITVGQLWDSPVYITYVRYCYYNIATQNLQN